MKIPLFILLFLLYGTAHGAEPLKAENQSKSMQTATPSATPEPSSDDEVPAYLNATSHWGVGFRAAKSEFPLEGSLGDTYQFLIDYLFPELPIGVFSLGTHFGSFPVHLPATGLPYPIYGNFIVGIQARYQFKFTKNQFFIPVGGVEWDSFTVLTDQGSGQTMSGNGYGLTAGLMLNLNTFDKKTVKTSYEELGLVRTYFTAELKFATLNSDLFNENGIYWFFGIRTEFE